MAESSENPQKVRTVVIAVDQSPESEQALDWFIENIYHDTDQIILVHVVEQPHLPFLADALVIEEWKHEVQKIEKELKKLEDKFLKKCADLKLHNRFRVEQGKPGEKIVEVAEQEKATLILISTRGAGLLSRTILGSVSNYVIHHTKIPIILCPKDHK